MTALLDAVTLGWHGVTGRPGRAVLSALGIALGIATLVLVTGIPASGQADLDRRLSALGTNLLVAQPAGVGDSDVPPTLDPAAAAMAQRIAPVEDATAVANLNLRVLRDDLADPNTTAGITALAAGPDLLGPLDAEVADGVFLTDATEHLGAVVLGASAADWLGVTRIDPRQPRRVEVGDAWLTVVGVLAPTPLTPELDQSVLVGWGTARDLLGHDGRPSVVYVRAVESQVEAVRAVLPATLDPELPGLLSVSRPSDVLAAKRATQGTFSALFLGLAGVALAVGGIGVANTMVVTVLERRREIGLRRALGATRRDVRGQFLVEAVLLSLLGGAAGTLVGVAGSAGYAVLRGWPAVVPLEALAGGAAGAVLVGALAGLYPAVRASRLAPTEALAA
jgi:putative ABC transport system permease protein